MKDTVKADPRRWYRENRLKPPGRLEEPASGANATT